MCGIAGYIGKELIEENRINGTLSLMGRRGPDYNMFCNFKYHETNIYLLHSRLSIIDLDQRSNQPFTIDEYTLVFNGEIYNYIEIREELKKKGHGFVTNSDTEVLLKAYIEYGEDCVKYFEGMWAFAIWNAKQGKLFLSRDRFAEKPLYMLKTIDGVYFGSEVKFIGKLYNKALTINQNHLLRYLCLGYKSLYKGDETFYNEIFEIKYASNYVISAGLEVKYYRYWEPKCNIDCNMTIEDAIEGAKHHLLESVKIRLRSDVPMAFCLSGGVDSASLVSIATKYFNNNVSAYSIIDSDERYNEYDNIKATVNHTGCRSNYVELSYENVLPRLQNLISYHDAPIATPTYLVHSMLLEKIANDGYKVAFSGTAADELFTGYYDHFLLHLYSQKDNKNFSSYLKYWEKNIKKFIRNPILKNPKLFIETPDYRAYLYDNSEEFMTFLKVDLNETFYEASYSENLFRNRMLNELFHEGTPPILHEDDLNSMYYSIENRSPYLDSRLFDFTYSIPSEYLIQKGYGKYILRRAMKGILNEKVRKDRQKKGFNLSINSIFDFKDSELKAYLLESNSPIADLIDMKKVEPLLSLNPAPNHYSKFLFSFINSKIFLEQQLDVEL